jgi:hypothetical protein
MSDYKVSVSNNNIKVSASNTKHETKVEMLDYATSLSRVGGQGTKGDSVTNVELRGSEIFATITRADGTTYEINAGDLDAQFNIDNLSDFTVANAADGDVLIYDGTDSQWKNHQLTTSKVLDIDNTGKEEGAVLVYDNATSKYKATTRIEKQETLIIGGSF